VLLLSLYVIVLGTAFGAGLYESRVVVPVWMSDPPASLINGPDSGRRFWAIVTTGPLTLLTIANLVAALQYHGQTRAWWIAAVVVTLVERIATFGYFIPTIIRVQRPTLSPAAVRAALARWVRLNYLRNLLTLGAWIIALRMLVAIVH
jgi:hypothetical protein